MIVQPPGEEESARMEAKRRQKQALSETGGRSISHYTSNAEQATPYPASSSEVPVVMHETKANTKLKPVRERCGYRHCPVANQGLELLNRLQPGNGAAWQKFLMEEHGYSLSEANTERVTVEGTQTAAAAEGS